MPLLLLPFFLWIVIEATVLILIGGTLGIGWTLLLYVGVSIFGLWLLRRQGVSALRGLRAGPDGFGVTVMAGGDADLAAAALHGTMMALAGLLLLIPGFVSDIFALPLLVPAVRRAVIARLLRRRPGATRQTVVDVEYEEIREDPAAIRSRWGRPGGDGP